MVDKRTNFAKDISFILRRNYGDKLRVFDMGILFPFVQRKRVPEAKAFTRMIPTDSLPKRIEPSPRRCKALAAKDDMRASIKLTTVDDLFSTKESREEAQREQVMEIPLVDISEFPDHPFRI